LHLLSAHIV